MEAWWPGQSLPGVRTKPQAYYGYELHAAIRIARCRADRNPDEPQLIERLRLTPAGQDIVEPSLQALDAILATGQPIRYLIVDRPQDTGLPIVASPPDPDHAPAICRQAVSP